MLKVSYHEDARNELANTGLYYASASPEIGARFFEKFEKALADIRLFPQAFPKVEDEVRRCLMHKFPFGICYQIEGDTIRILAIAHTSRHPDYWKYRK